MLLGHSRLEALLCCACMSAGALAQQPDPAAFRPSVQSAHNELWRRFIDKHNVMLDFAGLQGEVSIPTAQECLEDKPNALGWWTPIENGAMFNGLYMEALCLRHALTNDPADKDKARRLADGLMLLASLGKPGFIARGLATDDRTPYALGSNDQTLPWFYGLWRYLQSGIPDEAEHARIVAKMAEVGAVLRDSKWRMPTRHATIKYRGSSAGVTWEGAPRVLFILKALHQLTQDPQWDALYRTLLTQQERGGATRLEKCEAGMVFKEGQRHSWTGAVGVVALRALWELEADATIKEQYARGLLASAKLAADGIAIHKEFVNEGNKRFLRNWRQLNQWWKPQLAEADAVSLAKAQLRELHKLSPRRSAEMAGVREPAFAAWIVTLCPDAAFVEAQRAAILALIDHYRYETLYCSQFFPVEAACYRLALTPSPARP